MCVTVSPRLKDETFHIPRKDFLRRGAPPMQSIILSKTSRNMCSTSNLSCSFGGIDDDDDDDSDDDDSADDDDDSAVMM